MKKRFLCLMLTLAMNLFSDLSQKDEELFHAMYFMDLEAAKKALANGADVNAKDQDGRTVLYYAVKENCGKMVELLLANHVDVNTQNVSGITTLFYAIEKGNVQIVELLLNHGVDVNATVHEKKKLTPLLLAVKNKDRKIVELLLKRGANCNAVDINGITVFDWARFDNEIAKLLSMNVFSEKEEALFRAMELRDLASVKKALANGADVNVTNNFRDSPLIWAERQGHIETIQLLLEHGVNIDVIDIYGKRILHRAASNNHNGIIQLLLASGANVNAKDQYGNTALHTAASFDRIAIAQLLIASGVDVNAVNQFGETALYQAIKSSYFEEIRSVKMVELLLDHGVGINAIVSEEKKLTPLLWAVIQRQKEIVKLLLKRGADRKAVDIDGHTAFYWAQQYDPEIARMFR